MKSTSLRLSVWLGLALVLGACFDGPQTPGSRSEPPAGEETSILEPLDLVYVCGNKFLATNSTKSPVQVVYRVAGTDETGSLALSEGSAEDPGYSETELETSKRGVVELYHDDQLVVRRLNKGEPCGPPAMLASAASAGSAESGEWSAPFPWPVVALHVSLLPNGKVLSWGLSRTPQIWDPGSGNFTGVTSLTWVFCAGHSFLADGRLLVSGGHLSSDHGIPDNTIFNPASQSWTFSTPMRRGRWYPTNTTLGNGDVVILAGADEEGLVVTVPEVWSSGGLRALSTASRTLPYYPRAFLAPNGKLFYAGQQQMTRYLDPAGTGSWTTVGARLYGTRDYGAAVMYDAGKILYVGGGRTTNTAEVIDLNSAAPAWQWTGSMASPRRNLNATVLPTGEVLVTGGSSGPKSQDVINAVHAAELWDPDTGLWRTLASNTVSRTYHSTSILLPDGRVLHAGSGNGSGMPDELNAELFSPPYLLRGPRPTITDAPSTVRYGESFSVVTPEADAIAKVSLIRLGSTTHSFDMNQRFQWLSFSHEPGTLTVSVPISPNRTPPGHYMLFILDVDGVPSEARIVRVGSAGDSEAPPDRAPTASFTTSCHGFACEFTDTSTDDGRVTDWSWDFGDNSASSSARHPTHPYQAEGSYDVTLKATDNSGKTDAVTRTVTVTTLPPNAPPAARFTSSCTYLACMFADASTDEDGTVAEWSWDFGDGETSTAPNPSRTYASAGIYDVTLLVTDNEGATSQWSASATASAPPSLVLAATGRINGTRQEMTLTWSGAGGTTVDIYRNGSLLRNTANDGRDTNGRNFQGSATYVFKVCQAGTSTCSNEATVTFTGSFTLSATGQFDGTRQTMKLTWTGASGTTVDIYRNGSFLRNTANDGRDTNGRTFQGPATYIFKVCQAGTSTCSNEASVVFP